MGTHYPRAKAHCRKPLGGNKWRLWDWENDFGDDEDDDSGEHNTPRRPPSPVSQPTELDWQAHHEFFKNLPLSASNIARIRDELGTLQDYQHEIADEIFLLMC